MTTTKAPMPDVELTMEAVTYHAGTVIAEEVRDIIAALTKELAAASLRTAGPKRAPGGGMGRVLRWCRLFLFASVARPGVSPRMCR